MSHNNLVFHSHSHNFPPSMFNEQAHLPLFQYNTAYFNPYEVKHRKRTSRAQLTVLEATFQENNKPSSAVKKSLAAQLDMPIRNVQVWFQNRRAKDKNLAAKAKAKEAAAAAAADQAVRDGVEDDEDDDDDDSSGNPEASTPPAGSSSSSATSTLSPPSNLALRRGSAPNLGGNTPPDFASSTSTFKIRPSPPQAAARSASDSVRAINNPVPIPPTPIDSNIPVNVNLGRRKSLPAFHPSLQRQSGVPQIPALPTVADVSRLSQSPEADTKRIALGSAGPGSGGACDDMGHGGVYRSASSSRLSAAAAAAAPYPTPSSRGSSGNLMTYRSGSTPGTGVFRIPANPNPSNQSWQGTSTVSEDASFPGGLRQQTSSAPTDNSPNQPYSFPPRPYGDIPRAGPLPSKDFVFGDSGGAASSVGAFRDSPPSTTNEDEEERVHGLMQSQRFGSFASEFSIESDATGTTATTATSTDFSPHALGAAHVPPAAFRNRYPPAFGRGPGFGHANTDSGLGPSISYGMSSGSVAGLPGLSAGPVSYPTKFDPESRRASCPAHFIQDMASLAVDQFHQTEHPQDFDQGLSHNPLQSSLAVRRGVIRKTTSGFGLGRSPLGIQVPNTFNGQNYHGVPEEPEHEPQTATAGEYTQVLGRPSFSLDSSVPSTASDTTSHGTASSPEIYYHPSGSAQHSSSLENSSFPDSLPTNPGHSQANLLDANLTANLTYPVYMPNLTQEPAFDNSIFYNNGSQQNSQPQLVDSRMPFSTDNFQAQQQIFEPTFSLTGYDTRTSGQSAQHPVGGFEGQQQQQQATPAYANSNSSFTSFLHAPVPAPSSSSLAGALAPGNSTSNQQQW
ncbi:hypothetical protein M407DRAFT_4599 [Tulasnella calospora MUT 4182]|uniref:Homeobox domain-containing protein n=1 Tax=Tulasnella calospora MUT 4182 TaxID=1051891 RepID=A0A0C3QT00_9AGAM|nr:hypothetical protein M407DRAFT_4599 [Tulasnella calospora MUT 4182]